MNASQPPVPVFQPGRHLEIFDDTVHDPYHERGKPAEPAVCKDCGAVFHQGRWQWTAPAANAHQSQCPACKRIHEQNPAGYVSIEGQFAPEHKDEVLSLVRNLESREKAEHPLQRIMAVTEEASDKLLITTTDVHLAQTIGQALERAYGGELVFHYNKDEYLLHMRWRR